jgi:hypothetical protein
MQVGGLVLSVVVGYLAAYALVTLSSNKADQPARVATPARERPSHAWVEPLVQYHSLYVANTFKHVDADLDSVLAQLRKITDSTRLRTALPDLATEGYAVKHVQELGFNGQPLVQLLYAKADELPLAICVLPAMGDPDSAVRVGSFHGLQAASWIEGDQRFILVADEPRDKLEQLVRITQGVFPKA